MKLKLPPARILVTKFYKCKHVEIYSEEAYILELIDLFRYQFYNVLFRKIIKTLVLFHLLHVLLYYRKMANNNVLTHLFHNKMSK